ncbi:hypothetical protein GF314_10255 [bacterium]|nr:hypothetical protein [bacterium]
MHPVRILVGVAVTAMLAGAACAQSTTATGVSRASNPAISVNTLLLGRVADEATANEYNGIRIQEAEVQLTSIVDPYWKANLVFAVHPEHGHDHAEDGAEAEADGHDHGTRYVGDVEVAYVEGTALPYRLGLRVGKDYLPFGKHVPLHTHQFPFVDAPVAVKTFLGDHGLTEIGARLSRDLPLPWYSDLTAYAVDGKAEIFDAESRDLAFGARWTHLVDLGTESTLELGGSWLHGPQAHGYLAGEHAHEDHDDALYPDLDVLGADVTFKWVSASRSKGPALNVTGEVILPSSDTIEGDPFGWYAFAQYRFARSWWLGVGVGGLDLDREMHEDEHEHEEEEHAHEHAHLFAWDEVFESKVNLTWAPSEFSALRLEAAHYDDQQGDADDWLISLQANFTIGSHPAHSY